MLTKTQQECTNQVPSVVLGQTKKAGQLRLPICCVGVMSEVVKAAGQDSAFCKKCYLQPNTVLLTSGQGNACTQ